VLQTRVGCPLHPSYPSGHATVAGACSVMLKAFFDENEIGERRIALRTP
jgi:membrane-associated phospholipid phosphatase